MFCSQQTGNATGPISMNGGDDDDASTLASAAKPSGADVSPTQPTGGNTTSAISRFTNRFTSSASAMGRRALRTALHPGSGGARPSKIPMTLYQVVSFLVILLLF